MMGLWVGTQGGLGHFNSSSVRQELMGMEEQWQVLLCPG